jgi:hypothetical protein
MAKTRSHNPPSHEAMVKGASKARTPSGSWEECAIAYWKYRCYFGQSGSVDCVQYRYGYHHSLHR